MPIPPRRADTSTARVYQLGASPTVEQAGSAATALQNDWLSRVDALEKRGDFWNKLRTGFNAVGNLNNSDKLGNRFILKKQPKLDTSFSFKNLARLMSRKRIEEAPKKKKFNPASLLHYTRDMSNRPYRAWMSRNIQRKPRSQEAKERQDDVASEYSAGGWSSDASAGDTTAPSSPSVSTSSTSPRWPSLPLA